MSNDREHLRRLAGLASDEPDHLRRLAGLADIPQVPTPVANLAPDESTLRAATPIPKSDPEFMRRLFAAVRCSMPSVNVDPMLVRAEVRRVAAALPQVIGDRGPAGADGAHGPMPAHEWDGTKLRFEAEPGAWGEWVDLRGPRGLDGHGSVGQPGPIGPPGPPAPVTFSYFPVGW